MQKAEERGRKEEGKEEGTKEGDIVQKKQQIRIQINDKLNWRNSEEGNRRSYLGGEEEKKDLGTIP